MFKIIKGNVRFNADEDYSEVEEITGYLDCRGADTKASFPKLTTVGGYLYCSGADTKASFPKLTKTECGNSIASRKVISAFMRKGFAFFDGILSVIICKRENKNGSKVYKLQIIGKAEISYCIEIDGVFSHGKTIREARESLLYKISDRDKSAYEAWTPATTITKRQAIESYRVITGACESGCRYFVESVGKTKSKYTVQEIIDITNGQYGSEEYRKFFK